MEERNSSKLKCYYENYKFPWSSRFATHKGLDKEAHIRSSSKLVSLFVSTAKFYGRRDSRVK